MLRKLYFSSSSAVSCTLSVLCAWYVCIRCSGVILTARLPLYQILFLPASIAELACREKSLPHSLTQSVTHSLTQIIWHAGNQSFHFATCYSNWLYWSSTSLCMSVLSNTAVMQPSRITYCKLLQAKTTALYVIFKQFITFGSCCPNWLHGNARTWNKPEYSRSCCSLTRSW